MVEDVFVVKPGEAVATDGKVLVGSSSVNQAPVTGESVPVDSGFVAIIHARVKQGQCKTTRAARHILQ